MRTGFPALRKFILALASLTLGATLGFTDEVHLAWDPSSDGRTDGYKVYFSETSSTYPWSVDVGNQTQATIDGLTPGVTYYFTATAYDLDGDLESLFSNEVQVAIPAAPVPPSAAFQANPTSGAAPLDVSFVDKSSGDVVEWSWDFGDGGFSSVEYPLHTYVAPGRYTVRLTVTGPAGTDFVIHEDLVDVGNLPALTPAIVSPPPGSTVPRQRAVFQWTSNGIAVQRWRFQIGSRLGGDDIFASGNLSKKRERIRIRRLSASGGQTLFVRLWYRVDDAWHFIDNQYY